MVVVMGEGSSYDTEEISGGRWTYEVTRAAD